jgi:hypothetical protein
MGELEFVYQGFQGFELGFLAAVLVFSMIMPVFGSFDVLDQYPERAVKLAMQST